MDEPIHVELFDLVLPTEPMPYGEWNALTRPLPRSYDHPIGCPDLVIPVIDPVQPGCERRSWGVVHLKPGCRCPRVTGRAR